MDLLTSLTTLVLFAFIIYRDISHRKDMLKKDELIKDLTLKHMCKDVNEYLSATPLKEEKLVEEKDPFVEIDEVPFEKLEKAEDIL